VTGNRRRPSPPETLAQAAEWERTKMRYLGLGLCHKCAAQAAWGHQKGGGGWPAIKPPCADCAVVVRGLPMATPNPAWRKSPRHPSPPDGVPARPEGRAGANNGASMHQCSSAKFDEPKISFPDAAGPRIIRESQWT
jgi:hypothetical protein